MKTILDIQGMHCANCASTITTSLKRVGGVEEVTVNFATKTAVVNHAQAVTSKQLLQAVTNAGYTASLRQQRREGMLVQETSSARFPHLALGSAVVLAIIAAGPVAGLPVPTGPYNALAQLVLVAIIFLAGKHVFRAGILGALRSKQANPDTLIVLGVLAAFLFSAWGLGAWLVTGTFSEQYLYFHVAGLVLALSLLAQYFEQQAKSRTRDVLDSLLSVTPETARLVVDKREKEIPIEEVAVGDTLKVKPGDRIPVDGVILAGNSRVDESMLSGEATPVKKAKDDEVYAGTINKTGMFLLKTTATGSKTALARIVESVEQAQLSKAPIQQAADRISTVFVPVVIGLAALTFIGWLAFTPLGVEQPLTFALTAMIAVLIIACPSALLLATPTAITVAAGVGGSRGVLFKDAAALQQAASVRMVAFDKAGTLTVGKPRVQFIKTYNDLSEQVVFRYAASLESASAHPLAQALVLFAEKHNINYGDPRTFKEAAGRGISGKVEGRKIVIGSLDFFVEQEIGIFDARERIKELAKKQLSPVLVAIEGRLAAIIGIADPIRDSSADGVAALKKMGLQTAMLTSEREEVAQVVAREVGIGVVRAQLTPEQKLEELRRLRRKRPLAMVGDAVTSQQAFAEADVGVAIGAGSAVSLEAADVVLVGEDVTGVSRALFVARRAMRTIKQNLFWALGYNVLAIPLAAGLLYPLTGWLLSPVVAALVMALSSLSVVLNSLRLKKI